MAMAMPTAEKVYGEIVTTACDHELDGPAITAPYVGSGLCFCGSTRFTEKIDGECLATRLSRITGKRASLKRLG